MGSKGARTSPALEEVGVVTMPGTHVTNQGREPKPKTGGSRPGLSIPGTTPTSDREAGTHKNDPNTIWKVEQITTKQPTTEGSPL